MLYSKIEGQGTPLLILHGFLGMSDNWKTLGLQYSQAGFQVHMIDLRNHGRSFHSDQFDYDVMVEDVLAYCADKKLENICVIGHSMGGKVAMLLASKYPDLIKKLLVADIGPKFYPQHHQTILAGLNAVDFTMQPGRADVEAILEQYIPDFGTRQFLMKSLYWESPGQLAFRFNLKVFNDKIDQIGTALPEDYKFLKPTLFLRGSKSDYILDADADKIHHHFPLSETVTISNAGHWLHVENPKAFLEASLLFLNK